MLITFGELITRLSDRDVEDKFFDLDFSHRIFLLWFILFGHSFVLGHVGNNISIKYLIK